MIPLDDVAAGEVLVVRRLIPVSRERVFAAWLDPVGMTRWMAPGEANRAIVELEARVGGAFRIMMEDGGEHRGVYLAIEPPSLLSFTWMSAATQQRSTVVTVEFLEHDRGAATEVVLTHRGLPAAQLDPHRRGWSDILRKLGQVVAGEGPIGGSARSGA